MLKTLFVYSLYSKEGNSPNNNSVVCKPNAVILYIHVTKRANDTIGWRGIHINGTRNIRVVTGDVTVTSNFV